LTAAPKELAQAAVHDVERLRSELPGLASGAKTVCNEIIRLATPETELTVSEHADLYRVVSPESGSPFPGPWRTDRVPYLREPMDCLHPDHPARRITLKWSAQLGNPNVESTGSVSLSIARLARC
jgi:phage terminase large subunit GpA-like protein